MPPYGKAASDCPDSKALVVRRGDVFQYLVHLAAENPAQIVQGRGGDRLVFAQLGGKICARVCQKGDFFRVVGKTRRLG